MAIGWEIPPDSAGRPARQVQPELLDRREPMEPTEQMARPDRLVLQVLRELTERMAQMELTERLGQLARQAWQEQRAQRDQRDRTASEAPGPLIICRSSPGRRRSRIQSFSRHNRAAGAT